MTARRLVFFFLGVITALRLVLLAQSGSQPTFKSGVNFVEVVVIVTDRAGMPVGGLRRQDFEVLEDGKPVEVITFTAVDLPAAEPEAGDAPTPR